MNKILKTVGLLNFLLIDSIGLPETNNPPPWVNKDYTKKRITGRGTFDSQKSSPKFRRTKHGSMKRIKKK